MGSRFPRKWGESVSWRRPTSVCTSYSSSSRRHVVSWPKHEPAGVLGAQLRRESKFRRRVNPLQQRLQQICGVCIAKPAIPRYGEESGGVCDCIRIVLRILFCYSYYHRYCTGPYYAKLICGVGLASSMERVRVKKLTLSNPMSLEYDGSPASLSFRITNQDDRLLASCSESVSDLLLKATSFLIERRDSVLVFLHCDVGTSKHCESYSVQSGSSIVRCSWRMRSHGFWLLRCCSHPQRHQ